MIRSLTRSAVVLLGAVALVGGLAGQGPAAAADEAVQTSGFQTYDHDGEGGRPCAAGHERKFQGRTYCDQYASDSEHAGAHGGDEAAASGGEETATSGGDEAAASGGEKGGTQAGKHENYCAHGDDGYYYAEDRRSGSRCCPQRHYRHDRCPRYYYDDYYYDRYYYDRYYYYDRDRDHDDDNGHRRGDRGDGDGRGDGDRDGRGHRGGDGDGGGRGGDGDGGGRGGDGGGGGDD